MPFDVYQKCPGGTGNKIKHCSCCRDIVSDLEHIVKALEGGQRAAALDRVNRLLATHANRPSLLALKAQAQLTLKEMQGFDETVAAFVQVAPSNPLALAYSALSNAKRGDINSAVDKLQQALDRIDAEIPRDVYEIIGVVGNGLLDQGKYSAARAHFVVQLAMSRNEDRRPLQAIVEMGSPEQVPTLLKQDRQFLTCPNGASWAEKHNEAIRQANNGRWAAAVEIWKQLDEAAPREPSILHNLALLHMYLGRPAAVDYWQAYARCDGVTLQQAVEAEALAEILRGDTDADNVDVVQLTYPILDTDTLMEKLLSHNRVSSVGADPRQFAAEGEPPPKGVFWLLDRPMPASGSEVGEDDVPRIQSDVIVYGKQTDRDACLMLNAPRGERLANAQALLNEFASDLLGEVSDERVVGSLRRETVALGSRTLFPDDTPLETRREMMVKHRERGVFDIWPKTPMTLLDEKSPEQAASDPNLKARLLGMVLNLEHKCHANRWDINLNPLREKLGLPLRELIDPTEVDPSDISLVDLELVEVEKLDNEQLKHLHETATLFGLYVARRRLASELTRRDFKSEDLDMAEIHGELAELATDFDEALLHLGKAREVSVAAGQSPARWLLEELRIRMLRQDSAEAQELLNRLRTYHMEEPGISEALFEMLVEFGILTPQGQPAAAMQAAPGAGMPAGEADEAGKIWTPGQEASADKPKESKLWIPD